MRSFNIKIHNQNFTESNFREIPDLFDISEKEQQNKLVEFLAYWSDNKKYIEIKTSGSTGKPKNIKLLKESMILSAQNTCSFFRFPQNSNCLLCLPVDYIAGKMMLVRAMVSGLNLWISTPKSNPFKELDKEINFTAITPFQLAFSIDTIKEKKIKNIIVGGAPVSSELEEKTQDLEANIYETYGMTETSSHIALRKINGKDRSDCYSVFDNIHISTDERQCLIIDATGLIKEKITTNDIVEILNPKQFKWLGRADNIINSGGIKIFPEQVENKIANLIDRKFYISSEPDINLGEKLILIIEGNPLNKEVELVLLEKIRMKILRFEMPGRIKYAENIKTTATNKIIRN